MSLVVIRESPSFSKSLFGKYATLAVLMDENTRRHCYPQIQQLLPRHHVIEVPSGEENKTLSSCEKVWQHMTDFEFDRHSLLVVLGGGVLCDLGGFCASTYKRGIDFILMPTTLLAQVDASIGGKTGIDFGFLKNHLGTFQLPAATWIATNFLVTLPQAELRSGFAEVVKHCLISDKSLWNALGKRNLVDQPWKKLVAHSVKFKSGVVRRDPREAGLRKVLNFGHTIGHAIEGFSLKAGRRILHGDSIAAGMVLESHIAKGKKLLNQAEFESIRTYIQSVFGKLDVPDTEALMPWLVQDKKNKGKEIHMALPKHIGKAVWGIRVSEREIRDALHFYQNAQT